MIAAFTLNVSVDRKYVVENNRTGAVNRVRECTATAGGKGLNVARIIHALGEPVIAGGIAGGNLGNFVCEQLDAQGIEHRFTQAAGETRCCINICDTLTGIQTEYLEPGLTVSEKEKEAFFQDYRELCSQSSVITVSGSLPKGLSDDTYADLIRLAEEMKKPVLLDTSGEALRKGIGARPYYIKPNEDEIRALCSCRTESTDELIAGARMLFESGIKNAVVSMGSRGALLCCSKGVFLGKPPVLKAVNTVGCGDAMTAAFAVSVKRQMEPEESLRYAVAVSAASALHPDTGGVSRKDLEDILEKTEVRKIWL